MTPRIGPDPNYTRRYPGAPPFADLPLHRKLFFGRAADARNLVDTILAESLVVVYARSGSGKTSLINVAVKERLRSEGYAPLVVRIGKQDQNPLDAVFQGIAQSAEDQGFEHHIKSNASLWHYFKTAEFWQGDTLLKPVLVVDQFEELFTLHTQEERLAFARQVAHLLRGPAPAIDKTLLADLGDLSETPPPVKVVFSMREDFLAMLDELVPDLPNILTTRYRLSAMDREQAKQAIEGPAGVEDQVLEAPTFTYTEGTVQKIIDFLAEGAGPNLAEQGGINPFQIQIVCQHVEDLVLARTRSLTREKRAAIAISYEDLGGATGLRETVSQFYERQLNNFNPYLRRRIQRLCEEGLANREGRRIAQEQSEIVNRFGVDPRTLGRLVDLRLLQRERRLGGNHYELSHDTLLHPVLRARRQRASWWRMARLTAAVVVLIVALMTTIYFLRRSGLQRDVADYVRLSYQHESDTESRLIHAVAAVATSQRVTSLDPSALKALSEAEQVHTVFKTPLPQDVTNAVLSPDGQIVALARKRELQLRYSIDEATRKLEPAFGGDISILAFAPKGDRIAAAAGREIRVWDIAGRELGSITAPDTVSAIAFDPLMDGPGLAIATNAGGWSRITSRDKTWSLGQSAADATDRPGTKRPVLQTLEFSPDGSWIVGASSGSVVHAWARGGTFVRSVTVDAGLRKWTSWSDQKTGKLKWLGVIAGSRVTAINAEREFESQTLALSDSGTASVAATLSEAETDRRPAEIAFSPDGRYLAVGTMSGDVYVFQFDPATRKFTVRDKFGGQSQKPIRGLSWSPTDSHLLTMQEGASTIRAIDGTASSGTAAPNPAGAQRSTDVAREVREALVTRPLIALDGGGAIVTNFMQDWIKFVRPSDREIETDVFNPRVIAFEKDWLFAAERAKGFSLNWWDGAGTDRKTRWDGVWPGVESVRAASRTSNGVFVVAIGRPIERDGSSFDLVVNTTTGQMQIPGVRLYRGALSGGSMTEVGITGDPIAEITHAVAQSDGSFLLMTVDGALLALSTSGSITEVARVGGTANILFDQRGRLTTWLHGGQPRRWELRVAAPGSTQPMSFQDAPIKNSSKVLAVQSVVAGPTDEFVVADDAGDVHVVEALDSGTELRQQLLIKANVGEVRQLVSASPAAVGLVARDAAGVLSIVHVRGRLRADPESQYDGHAIAVGDRGRLVAMLNPDKLNPEVRLSGADLEETGLVLTSGGRCYPSAIAASPTSDVLIIGCREGLMAAVTATGGGLPHPEPAFDPPPAECWFERPPAGDPPIESGVVALAFAPSGRFFAGVARHRIAVWNADGSLRVKAQQPTFQAKDDWITSLAISPNDIIAVGTAKGTLILMNVDGTALKERSSLQAMMAASVTAIAFSPNGRQIVAGFDNGSIQPYVRRWWWSTTYTPISLSLKTDARVVSLAFAPDGERFASGGANSEVRLWSSTFEPVAAAPATSNSPTAVAFSADGLRLLTSADTSVENVWSVPTSAWIAEACQRLAWSHRLRESSSDAIVAIVRDACRPAWVERQSATPLVTAAAAGQIDVVDSLLARNADPNAADELGRTPLMRAVTKGHVAIARLLVAKGADVARRDAIGATVLHHAAAADARSIVSLLLDTGAPVNQTDQNGRTPLMLAAGRGHHAMAQLLIDKKADVNAADEFGRTAFISAAEADRVEVVTLLRGAGADVNARERVRLAFGKTAGQLAGRAVETELINGPDSAKVITRLTPMLLFRVPVSALATNDAQRQRAERLVTWRRGGMAPADAIALARDLSAAVTAAGEKPDPADLVLLGFSRGFGVDGKPDWAAARQEFARAASLKSKLAATLETMMMLEGIGGPQQWVEGTDRLAAAASGPDAEPLGAWLLAVLHRDRYLGGDQDEREAKAREFMKIATTGLGASFGPAWNSQAFIDINDPRRVAAELVNACASQFRLSIETAAKAGDVVAAGNLAEWDWYGRDPKGIEKLKAVASQAPNYLPIAQRPTRLEHIAAYRVGLSYAYGIGVTRDYAQALKWLTEAAAGGNFEANRELGRMYELGLGVPSSLSTAVTHYRRAAADGEVYSRNRLRALGYVH